MSAMPESVVLRQFTGAPGENLSDTNIGARLDDLRRGVRAGMRIFILDWEGGMVPLDVVIDGKEIGGAQNGRLTSAGGQHIASYERTIIHGGVSGEHHQMIIYII